MRLDRELEEIAVRLRQDILEGPEARTEDDVAYKERIDTFGKTLRDRIQARPRPLY